MKITVSILLSYLPEDAGVYCPRPENEILAVRKIGESGTLPDSACLYLANIDTIGDFERNISLKRYENRSILLCFDGELPDSITRQTANNIIVLRRSSDYIRIADRISTILDHGYAKSVMTEDLLEMVKDGCELQEMMDYGFRKLGNPILLLDASFNYLASAGVSDDINEPVWEYTVRNGNVPDFFLGYIEYDPGASGGIVSAEESDILKMNSEYSDFINHRMTFIKITQHRHVIGYLAIMERREIITEYDISILRLVGGFLAIELAKSVGKTNYNFTLIDNFLISILKNGISSPEEIEMRQKLLELRLKKSLYVITVEILSGQLSTDKKQHLLSKLRSRLRRNTAVLLNRHIVILYDTDRTDKDFREYVLGDIRSVMKTEDCRANISHPFSSLTELYSHYVQTLHCIKMREVLGCEKTLLNYDDVIDYHMIFNFFDTTDPGALIHSSVKTLMENDRLNDSSYVETLFTYLKCGRNLSDAAKRMSLHYNTMKYRINRIISMTGIDFEDERVIFRLMVTERVLRLTGSLEYSDGIKSDENIR